MSWLRAHDEVWPVTDDAAQLRVHLRGPDMGGPAVSWALDLFHCVQEKNLGQPAGEGWVSVEVSDLAFIERDWRRFANLEIRADPAWQATREYCGQYGQITRPQVTAHITKLRARDEGPGREARRGLWTGHDFILRFGARDGWGFACELDAWLLPDKEYYRTVPETPEELARFAEGPPNLRMITTAVFTGGTVCLSRCGDDPLPWTRRRLREETGCEGMFSPAVGWALRDTRDHKELVRMPGWRSDVNFSTMPVK